MDNNIFILVMENMRDYFIHGIFDSRSRAESHIESLTLDDSYRSEGLKIYIYEIPLNEFCLDSFNSDVFRGKNIIREIVYQELKGDNAKQWTI